MESARLIVVGLDGSQGSHQALQWAMGKASAHGGTVRAITAWRWDLPCGGLDTAGSHLAAAPKQLAQEILRRAAATLPVRMPLAALIVEGRAPDVLAAAARDADLLVLGSHGRETARHTLLGSVAEEVVRKTSCPVVVVPAPGPGHTRVEVVEVPVSRRVPATGRPSGDPGLRLLAATRRRYRFSRSSAR